MEPLTAFCIILYTERPTQPSSTTHADKMQFVFQLSYSLLFIRITAASQFTLETILIYNFWFFVFSEFLKNTYNIVNYRDDFCRFRKSSAKYAVNNFFRKIFLVCTLGKKNNNNTELYGVNTKAVNLLFSSLTMAFFVGNPK